MAGFESSRIGSLYTLQVVGMDISRPNIFKSSFGVAAGEANPSAIDISDVPVLVAHPDEGRCCVRHHPEALLTFAKSDFGFPSSRALPQQSSDQQGLEDDHRDSGKDVFLVSFPDRRLAVEHQGLGRQLRLCDIPTAKLPPIDLHPDTGAVHDWNAFGFLSREHTGSDFASFHPLLIGIRIRPSDRSVIKAVIVNAVRRKPLGDGCKNVIRSDNGVRRLLWNKLKENNRMWGKRRYFLQ